jgi:hypothetical protein
MSIPANDARRAAAAALGGGDLSVPPGGCGGSGRLRCRRFRTSGALGRGFAECSAGVFQGAFDAD